MHTNEQKSAGSSPTPCSLHPTPSSGFTLLEAMVTLAMIAIISGLVMTGIVTSRRGAAARHAAQQFAGHLREASTLAQNGVKAPGCTPLTDPRCSQYTVDFTNGANTYSRRTAQTTGSGTTAGEVISYTLPGGVVFRTTGSAIFQYQPPLVSVTSPASIRLEHVSASAARACIFVSTLGVIEVRPSGC